MGDHQVNSPPCELGASVGSASGLVQPLRTDPSPARSCGRTRQIHVIPSLHRRARALGAQIVDRGCTRAKKTSDWPLAMLRNGTAARTRRCRRC